MDSVPQPTSLVVSSGEFRMTIDQCVIAWLHAKATRTDSEDTKKTYTFLIESFRKTLRQGGVDLDGEPHLIAMIAQGWAAHSPQKGKVAPSTFNHRLATISSFYIYAMKHEVLKENPIILIDRRPVEFKDYAQPLDKDQVQEELAKIDRRFLPGKRDYALLILAITTGRRSIELANLRMGDFQMAGSRVTVIWRRCKGGKQMSDILMPPVVAALKDYLSAVYGDYTTLPDDIPIWLSFARNGSKGEAIGKPAISDICKRVFGTSKVHSLRHTFAISMEIAGAKLSDIGARLGHNNLATTSAYMQRMHASENPFAEKLVDLFGLGENQADT